MTVDNKEIALVRHGRSTHVHAGWMDRDAFLQWRSAYEAAGIDPADVPPAAVQELASAATIVVTSETARAVESARKLAPGTPIVTSPLLHELELTPPSLGRIRMPLIGWALSFGVRQLIRREPYVTPAEHARAGAAADWLASLAADHDRVLVVTHASFRSVLTAALTARGWTQQERQGRLRHWSAWRFVRVTGAR